MGDSSNPPSGDPTGSDCFTIGADPVGTAGCLKRIFLEARTHSVWRDAPVDDDILWRVVETAALGPTSVNQSPARYVFVKSAEAKVRLIPLLSEGNRAKTLAAPVCAIIGYDLKFYDHLPKLFPHTDAKSWFDGAPPERIITSAFRNGTLQGAYFIIAARAFGLDVGPMSGFDEDAVTHEFFPGTDIKANFLCNVGYGDPDALKPRLPRFSFTEIAKIL